MQTKLTQFAIAFGTVSLLTISVASNVSGQAVNQQAQAQAKSIQPVQRLKDRAAQTQGQSKDQGSNPRIVAALKKCDQVDAMLANVKARRVAKGAEAKAAKIVANLTKSSNLCAEFRAKNGVAANPKALPTKAAAVRKVTAASTAQVAAKEAAAAAAAKVAAKPVRVKATPGQLQVCERLKKQYDLVSGDKTTRSNEKLLTGLRKALEQCANLVR